MSSVNVPVAVHVIRKGTGTANGDDARSRRSMRRSMSECGARRHRLAVLLHAGERRPHRTNATWYTHDAGLVGRSQRQECASRRRTGHAEPVHGWHRIRGAARLGDLPAGLRRQPEATTASSSSTRPVPGGDAGPVQRGRHRAPTRIGHWMGLYPHVPGRLQRREERLWSRHAGREVGGVRLPDRPRLLLGAAPARPRTRSPTSWTHTDDACT